MKAENIPHRHRAHSSHGDFSVAAALTRALPPSQQEKQQQQYEETPLMCSCMYALLSFDVCVRVHL